MTYRRRWSAVFVLTTLAVLACAGQGRIDLGQPQRIADGIDLFQLSDPALLDPAGPIAVQLLRLDPLKVDLRSALSQDEVMGTETVLETAARQKAVAAINAGFFSPNGDPQALLKLDGSLVSETSRARGAVGIVAPKPGSPLRLLFDRVTVSVSVQFESGGQRHTVPVAGVDTTRVRGKLMLFTPRYHADTDTAPGGTEWILDGSPLAVVERRDDVGKSVIPRNGAVLSFGGTEPPPPLDALARGTRVSVVPHFKTLLGSTPSAWAGARDIVSGAGLLVTKGRALSDWTAEHLSAGFHTQRHPRTMIGVDDRDAIWLVTVDGRQPALSLGMTFAELQSLARDLNLREALNLDGGGSTTMVVNGKVVNHPSDAAGPRKVGDALLVFLR